VPHCGGTLSPSANPIPPSPTKIGADSLTLHGRGVWGREVSPWRGVGTERLHRGCESAVCVVESSGESRGVKENRRFSTSDARAWNPTGDASVTGRKSAILTHTPLHWSLYVIHATWGHFTRLAVPAGLLCVSPHPSMEAHCRLQRRAPIPPSPLEFVYHLRKLHWNLCKFSPSHLEGGVGFTKF